MVLTPAGVNGPAVPAPEPGAMKAGELLELAFRLYRRRLKLFVAIMTPPALVAALAAFPFRLGRAHLAELTGPGVDPLDALGAAAAMLLGLCAVAAVSMAAYAVGGGAVAIATRDAAAGRGITALRAYTETGGRAATLLAALAVLLLVGGSLSAAAGAIAAAPLATVAYLGLGSVVGSLAAAFGFLLAAAGLGGVWLALMARYGLVVQAIVLDDLGAFAALRRSSSLTRRARGRVILVFLIMILISSVGQFLAQGPFEMAGAMAARMPAAVPIWADTLSALAGCACGAILGPLLPIALTLLHGDLRANRPPRQVPPAPSSPGRPAATDSTDA